MYDNLINNKYLFCRGWQGLPLDGSKGTPLLAALGPSGKLHGSYLLIVNINIYVLFIKYLGI